MTPLYYGPSGQKMVWFEGDSLLSRYPLTTPESDINFTCRTAYDTIRASTPSGVTILSLGGQFMSTINTNKGTDIIPYIKAGHIVVVLAGTNDLGTGAATAAQLYALMISFRDSVRATRAKIVMCTIPARDFSGDSVGLLTAISDTNALINNSGDFDAVANLWGNANLNTRAGCSNGTYYHTDKLHLVSGGSNLVASIISTAVLSVA